MGTAETPAEPINGLIGFLGFRPFVGLWLPCFMQKYFTKYKKRQTFLKKSYVGSVGVSKLKDIGDVFSEVCEIWELEISKF